jgi:hypothetical protein
VEEVPSAIYITSTPLYSHRKLPLHPEEMNKTWDQAQQHWLSKGKYPIPSSSLYQISCTIG